MIETLLALIAGIAAAIGKPYFALQNAEQHKNFSKFVSVLGRLCRSILARGETEVKYLKQACSNARLAWVEGEESANAQRTKKNSGSARPDSQ